MCSACANIAAATPSSAILLIYCHAADICVAVCPFLQLTQHLLSIEDGLVMFCT